MNDFITPGTVQRLSAAIPVIVVATVPKG